MKVITSIELALWPQVFNFNVTKLEKEKGHENISQHPPLLCYSVLGMPLPAFSPAEVTLLIFSWKLLNGSPREKTERRIPITVPLFWSPQLKRESHM